MANGQWYPPEWPERIRALAEGTLIPVPPKRAATVMLLKDTPTAPVVHMLRRRASMAFAGGAYAYPGRWRGPTRRRAPVPLGGPRRARGGRTGSAPTQTSAQAVVCAAVRETYEEAGVLLAGPTPDTVVGDTTGEDWEAERAALVARDLSFAEFLDRRGLAQVSTSWASGPAGSPRSSRPAATTPGSSWPHSRRASAPATPPRRPTARSGSAPRTRRTGTTRASS